MSQNVTVTLARVEDTTIEGAARQHRVVIDRPEAKGGRDQGPMGGELLLLGLGGCFLSNLIAAARARKVAVDLEHGAGMRRPIGWHCTTS